MNKYHAAQGNDDESLSFMADDNDDYKIVLQSLKTYWGEKRFAGAYNMFHHFPSLVCCRCAVLTVSLLLQTLRSTSRHWVCRRGEN